MSKVIPWKLITAYLKEQISLDEEKVLQQWLKEEDNRNLFQEIEELWNEIRYSASKHNPNLEYYWAKMEKRIEAKPVEKEPNRLSLTTLITVAASILLIFGLSVWFINNSEDEIHSFASVSGKSKLLLPDSSVVWLNSGSTMSYKECFKTDRHLDVQGEASFEVAKDKKHPFIVSTAGIAVKVYGTQFNINSYEQDENVVVTLKEGEVSIILNETETFLKPGEKAIVNKKDKSINIEDSDTSLDFFWANESVYFKSKSLGHICKYLERWYNVSIEVDPDLAESQFYTFTIKDDSLDAILRIMSKINPISYSFTQEKHVKITKVKPKH